MGHLNQILSAIGKTPEEHATLGYFLLGLMSVIFGWALFQFNSENDIPKRYRVMLSLSLCAIWLSIAIEIIDHL
ncbi:hypothetical protein [Providencia sp. PROV132]|uniref:hypothetical protein n=1 Tax=Providencia sp. PROV132 TaxID=2949842 RepID=UPI00234BF435|nr:hypothetical protein [Providencia sp. PROV132]